MRLLKLFVCAGINLWCLSASAEIVTNPADIMERLRLKVPGAWLDQAAVQKCLATDIEAESLRRQLQYANGQIVAEEGLTKIYQTKYDLAVQSNSLILQQNSDIQKLNKELEHQLDRWYRNPVVVALMTAGGVILAGAVTYGVVKIVQP